MCDTIIIDAKDILFCCGPCNSIDIEPEDAGAPRGLPQALPPARTRQRTAACA